MFDVIWLYKGAVSQKSGTLMKIMPANEYVASFVVMLASASTIMSCRI